MAGSLYLTGIGIALCVVAGVFLWLMSRSYLRAQNMTEWPQVPAMILESGVKRIDWAEGMPPSFKPEVLYRYRVGEVDHESARLGLRPSPGYKNEAEAVHMVKNFAVGKVVTCWVDPKDAALALLKLDSRAAGYSLWFPGLFFLGGLGMIYGAWKPGKSKNLPPA